MRGPIPNGDPVTQREFALYREYVTSRLDTLDDGQKAIAATLDQVWKTIMKARDDRPPAAVSVGFLSTRGRRLLDQMIPAVIGAVVGGVMVIFVH